LGKILLKKKVNDELDESLDSEDDEENNEDEEDTFGDEEEQSASDTEVVAEVKDDFRLTDESERGDEFNEKNASQPSNGSENQEGSKDDFLSEGSSCSSSGDDSLDDQFALDLERDLFNKKN
jgi:hypothetical protein